MKPKIEHVEAREGYDRWAGTYDETLNPVVAMDERHTSGLLAPRRGERILDAGCGTGRHLGALRQAGAAVVGVDFSEGMLAVARERFPDVRLVQVDLHRPLPFEDRSFDAVLCSLVGEHFQELEPVFTEFSRILVPGGRLVFSVYHPAMAAVGKEANFDDGEVEVRLGAERHTVEDYVSAVQGAGFPAPDRAEFKGDAALAAAIPKARRLEGFPILLVLEAHKAVS